MENCVFCKIVKRDIPSTKIYEDDEFLVFLDINPVSDGHLLIIPKAHMVWMQDAPDDTISKIFKLAKKIMKAIIRAVGSDYVQLSIVGKDVPHFHIHLIPRYLGDNLPQFPTKTYKEKAREDIASKISREL